MQVRHECEVKKGEVAWRCCAQMPVNRNDGQEVISVLDMHLLRQASRKRFAIEIMRPRDGLTSEKGGRKVLKPSK